MFITLEGPEGSGKTSQIPLLADWLRQQGRSVLTTREPGGTTIGNQVREVLLSNRNQGMHPRTEILLFLAGRAQHVEEIIRPALARDEIVLCDRYIDSTMAYQGYGQGLELDVLRQMLRFSTGGLMPDLTLLLDVETGVGLGRRRSSGGEWNRLDAFPTDFHERVRRGYLTLAAEEPERFAVIDAGQAPEAVQTSLRQAVSRSLDSQRTHTSS